jgi:hypothetical protein
MEYTMTVRYWQIIGFICVLFVARGSGQTTQPAAPSPWTDLVNKVGTLLIEEPASGSLTELIPDDVPIRQFNSTEIESRYRLQQKTGGMIVVATRGYSWPSVTLASDLSTDLQNCEALPEPIRKQFTPRDDAGMVRANSVAQQWISGVLQPTTGQCVAILVLWEHPPAAGSVVLSGPSENKQPLMILIKGQKIDEDQFRITQISYGDVRQALN